MKTFKELYEACCAACEKTEENMEESDSGLAAKAEKSGVSLGTLKKVYKRGVAAWNSGHRPGTTPQQWGMARVNSYITKGKGTYHGADKDLREEELEEVAKDKESGLPKKYVSGLSPSTAKARAAHWDKMDKLSDKDPAAYEPAPGDATAKTKESKHTIKARKMFGEACWTGYKKVGMKKKGDKMVPNCVPEEVEQVDEVSKKSTLGKFLRSKEADRKGLEAAGKVWAAKDDKEADKNIRKSNRYFNLTQGKNKTDGGFPKTTYKEEVEQIDEGSMDTMNLKQLSDKHKSHHESGRGSERSYKAMGAIEKHVEKKYGKKAKDKMVGDTDHYAAHGGSMPAPRKIKEENENKPLNKPMRDSSGKKKFKVFVKNEKGNVVKVGFGDPNMEIKRDDPERRKNFRARHNCDTANDKTTPRYWSCKNWSSKPVSDIAK